MTNKQEFLLRKMIRPIIQEEMNKKRDLNLKGLNEAPTAGRGWSGKIKNLDNLLSWMYDKDILTQTDKNKKDVVFRQYYRYYNDGDFPRGLSKLGIHAYSSKEKIEAKLEELLTNFIKSMLSKYAPKIDRTKFRYDQLLGELNTVKSVIDGYDSNGILGYWKDKVKIADTKFSELLDELRPIHDSLKNMLPKEYSNVVLRYAKDKLVSKKEWTPEMQSKWKEITRIMDEMSGIFYNTILATKRIKAELDEK